MPGANLSWGKLSWVFLILFRSLLGKGKHAMHLQRGIEASFYSSLTLALYGDE